MAKVSSITGLKAVNYSAAHAGKVFTSLDQIVAEATEHEDKYFGGKSILFHTRSANIAGHEIVIKIKTRVRIDEIYFSDFPNYQLYFDLPFFQSKNRQQTIVETASS
jgi:hypothetical protein